MANAVKVRRLSQYLSVRIKGSKNTLKVNLSKVPSNYGYYTSRCNRLYNEDNFNVAIINRAFPPKSEVTIAIGDDANEELDNRADDKLVPFEKENDKVDGKMVKVFNFNIFDGHGGDECSRYLATHLSDNIENYKISSGSIEKLFKGYVKSIGGYWRRWYKRLNRHLSEVLKCDLDEGKDFNYESPNQKNTIKQLYTNSSENKPIWQSKSIMESLNSHDYFILQVYLSFLYTDYQFLTHEHDPEKNGHHSGSTCSSVFLYTLDPNPGIVLQATDFSHVKTGNDRGDNLPFDDVFFYEQNALSKLVVAHVGDTRVVLCDKNGLAHPLTHSHHPSNPIESRRLSRFSAGLMMTDSFGEERFINFANTRSFGDLTAKNKGVSAEPEISQYLIGNSTKLQAYKDQNSDLIASKEIRDFGGNECFLALVTDGVTDHLSDQEIVDLVMTTTNNKGLLRGTPHEAAKEVIKFVECVGGDDNATCNIIKLNGWGNWPMMDRTGKLREDKMMQGGRARLDR
ncbi:Mitochondrial type 2C protein phosphatase (PP2C) [Komagataella phaffii CBS 7435]|uniref:Mitochondrial protein phosphatase of type 2C with similarity to mammalian PP1Ks n=2 Tax=Komagataella phaffii TaxID=460519 RepID=C4QWM8_KOMPG|nr:uncharacterized protein PAS_chr1-1_0279 [Komagataella phaffii GS115]AOA60743.1 GQ67_02861T0 [Komagataella phaffii]CAH2446386.1 Mitochondrial type 2C protein phosphatase (PP2C) [Komagataella phaffii CBS 7435]AOA65827.1 GQ68_02386T0 [Komagataella phaffii GS115]CAY67651.1 Mitochondrial protein phosphatase of type 2C with similarity to mammalian PP1Ks [Komagataella phaffii GS115]CCA36745.1 Mitochondrial type 2C protein phosphatase (PP2C) [Komagataella phaffii CBS 7435]